MATRASTQDQDLHSQTEALTAAGQRESSRTRSPGRTQHVQDSLLHRLLARRRRAVAPQHRSSRPVDDRPPGDRGRAAQPQYPVPIACLSTADCLRAPMRANTAVLRHWIVAHGLHRGALICTGDGVRFGCVATFFAVERVTGIEPVLSAWEEFLSHRVPLSCTGIGGLN